MKKLLSIKERRGPLSWMAGHSVAANLAMLICLVGGFIALRNIKQEVFPDIEMDEVQVSVVYPGASPEEVEQGILLVIEEAVRSIDGVTEVYSTASEGRGQVNAELLLGVDRDKVARDIDSEIDKIRTFPEDAEEPEVRVASRKRDVMEVVIYGNTDYSVLHRIAENLREFILEDPNVTLAELEDVPGLEIAIEIKQEELRRYNLTIPKVAEVLRKATVDLPGGGLKTEKGDILVRVSERKDYGREFARIPILSTPGGGEILLGDVAIIKDGFEETDQYSTYNGLPSISIEIFRIGKQTPLSVSEAVRKRLEEYKPRIPEGVNAVISDDRSEIYMQRVELLLKNAAMGLSLVLILLGLFLEIRLAFWVMMGIPISFLGGFLFLPAMGITINMISLFAFIIALGIVVDDAIVVGENVYYYRTQGYSALEAAIKGTKEVAMPVTFSITTNIAAFLPIYFIPGHMGKIFQSIPVVVCTVFVISLFESIFILPAHLAHQKKDRMYGIMGIIHRGQQAFSRWFIKWVKTYYGPFLTFTLRHRYITVSMAIAVLSVILSYALSGRIRMQLFPVVESDYSEVNLVLPFGSPVKKTEAITQKLINSADSVVNETGRPDLVKSIIANIGREGSHSARVRVELAEPEIRSKIMGTQEFTNRWRKEAGEIPDVEYIRFSAESGGPGSRGRPIEVELSHADIPILEKASRDLAEILATYPRVKDVDDGFQPGKEQLDFRINQMGRGFNLQAQDIARHLRSSFYGAEVLKQQRGRNEITVIVRLPEQTRSSEKVLDNLMIPILNGTYVPLASVSEMKRGRAYTSIKRRNGRRVITVSADIDPRSMADEVLTGLTEEDLPLLVQKYPNLTYSFQGHRAEISESMSSLKISFILAMLVIYAMLAIPFRSYSQPFIVMLSIPFGVVGAILGHLIMGFDLCIPSMFGIVALSGVVVNDSLVLIDCANNRRNQDGMSHWDSIHSAAIQRFRPVLLTTLTTFAGLAPMIFETSRQARFLIPMALSLGFGILFATLITLIIVPAMYILINEWKNFVAKVTGVIFYYRNF